MPIMIRVSREPATPRDASELALIYALSTINQNKTLLDKVEYQYQLIDTTPGIDFYDLKETKRAYLSAQIAHMDPKNPTVWKLVGEDGNVRGYYETSVYQGQDYVVAKDENLRELQHVQAPVEKTPGALEIEDMHVIGTPEDLIEKQILSFVIRDSIKSNAPSICIMAERGTEQLFIDTGFKYTTPQPLQLQKEKEDANKKYKPPQLLEMNQQIMQSSYKALQDELRYNQP